MEKLLIFSSDDKNTAYSGTNSDFTITLKETYSVQNIKSILVKEVQVPHVQYNIRASNGIVNNSFKMKETGQADATFTIPEGQYVTSTFLTALQSAMNTNLVSGTVVITQTALTQKLNFTFTATTAILYNLDDGNLMADASGITTTTAASANIDADSLLFLTGTELMYIHSPELSENHGIDGDFGLIDVLESISLHDVPFGALAYRQNNDDELARIKYASLKNLNKVNINLRDGQGNKIDIGTGKMTVIVKAFY